MILFVIIATGFRSGGQSKGTGCCARLSLPGAVNPGGGISGGLTRGVPELRSNHGKCLRVLFLSQFVYCVEGQLLHGQIGLFVFELGDSMEGLIYDLLSVESRECPGEFVGGDVEFSGRFDDLAGLPIPQDRSVWKPGSWSR